MDLKRELLNFGEIETFIIINSNKLSGRIDALVLQERLWVVLIESKKTTFDLELALPQTLAYMAASPNREQPLYGMVMNGSSYLFVKLWDKQYGISDLFATRLPFMAAAKPIAIP
jgi:hypothetical protein